MPKMVSELGHRKIAELLEHIEAIDAILGAPVLVSLRLKLEARWRQMENERNAKAKRFILKPGRGQGMKLIQAQLNQSNQNNPEQK